MKGHLRFRPEKGKASKRCSVPNQDKQYGKTESYKPERYGQVKHKQFQGGAHLVPWKPSDMKERRVSGLTGDFQEHPAYED